MKKFNKIGPKQLLLMLLSVNLSFRHFRHKKGVTVSAKLSYALSWVLLVVGVLCLIAAASGIVPLVRDNRFLDRLFLAPLAALLVGCGLYVWPPKSEPADKS